MGSWCVYFLRCVDDTLYCGVTTNIVRRVQEHNHHPTKGAKYTRSRRPVALAWCSKCESRGEAYRREYRLKKLTRKQKEIVVKSGELALTFSRRDAHAKR